MDNVTVSDSTGDLPSSQRRYLRTRRHGKSLRQRTLSHRVRLTAKRYIEEHPGEAPCRTHRLHGVDCKFTTRGYGPLVPGVQTSGVQTSPEELARYQQDRQHRSRLRHHAEHDFRAHLLNPNGRDFIRQYARGGRIHWKPARSRIPAWSVDEDDALALALSNDPLPCDRQPSLQRRVSLEREEAFCDAKTFKGKVCVKPMPNVSDDDAQVAELYRMGLLYDEAEQRQSAEDAFTLNDIHHDEPVYSVRPARRGRKSNNNKSRGYDGPLPLDLSFSDLGKDDDLAPFLASPESHTSNTNDDSLQHSSSSRRSSRQTSVPLRVIYELATARPSFDVDTSQPPDLMSDSLSDDYDCFSDSELDRDVPSQREVHDATTSGPWVLLGDDS
ncbi:hypothetical protein ACRE_036340 [Hapsidospora chrysogenum ATCC 11550]|uniref:Uncharacterized protein n=1 Tax=Hapsidospora chrysogenum (strain ATCC 11550 / CBS 779.69 / DSM 880 / IAM 14645 / JCM 23072 / IMI 49137) TaxID=857340 RepID=A0A086T890_HAPC1|nr:hypothetical protein ACRE_036340 [Hapsidospora chrysogenum ATCC 11550]